MFPVLRFINVHILFVQLLKQVDNYKHYCRPVQHPTRESFFCGPLELPPVINCRSRIFSRLLYNEIDFCNPQKNYVDQFGPSSFLSCAGLHYCVDII